VSGASLCHQGSQWSSEEFLWDLMAYVWHISSSTQFSFHSIPFQQLSEINVIIGHNLSNYAQAGIPERLIDGKPQCNSSLEP